MPRGNKRSRTLRRVYVRTPGGRTVIHYKERRTGKHHCSFCKKVLAGVAYGKPTKIAKLSKTERRPERPYGGMLCSACMRRKIIGEARAKNV